MPFLRDAAEAGFLVGAARAEVVGADVRGQPLNPYRAGMVEQVGKEGLEDAATVRMGGDVEKPSGALAGERPAAGTRLEHLGVDAGLQPRPRAARVRRRRIFRISSAAGEWLAW